MRSRSSALLSPTRGIDLRFARVVAVRHRADDARAAARREQQFGDVRREADDALGRLRERDGGAAVVGDGDRGVRLHRDEQAADAMRARAQHHARISRNASERRAQSPSAPGSPMRRLGVMPRQIEETRPDAAQRERVLKRRGVRRRRPREERRRRARRSRGSRSDAARRAPSRCRRCARFALASRYRRTRPCTACRAGPLTVHAPSAVAQRVDERRRGQHEARADARQPEELADRAQHDEPFARAFARQRRRGIDIGERFIDDQRAAARRKLRDASAAACRVRCARSSGCSDSRR